MKDEEKQNKLVEDMNFIEKIQNLHESKYKKNSFEKLEQLKNKNKNKIIEEKVKNELLQQKNEEIAKTIVPFDFENENKSKLEKAKSIMLSNDLKSMIVDFKDRLKNITENIDEKFVINVKKMVSVNDENTFKNFFEENEKQATQNMQGFYRKQFYLKKYVFNKY